MQYHLIESEPRAKDITADEDVRLTVGTIRITQQDNIASTYEDVREVSTADCHRPLSCSIRLERDCFEAEVWMHYHRLRYTLVEIRGASYYSASRCLSLLL
jgi:hypothetical protein